MAEKEKSPYGALRLIWLLDSLRAGETSALILFRKTELLENLLRLIRQGHKEWVGRICYILCEGNLPPQPASSLLPEGMLRGLLKWVNAEKAEKVREILWAILLRKEIGLATFAKIADVAAGLCEKDPITRNNVIRFLCDHFTPEQVVDSLFQYSMASGKRAPGAALKRYVSLLRDREGQRRHKKYLLEKILSSAELDDTEIDEIFSDYLNSLHRFDLIRLLSSSGGGPPRIEDLKRKGTQMAFAFDDRMAVPSSHEGFRQRISAVMSFGLTSG
jgi:hypothetical protein